MGEAKRRGSQEQRTESAKQRKTVTVDEFRKIHNVPDEAIFDGFIVWLKNRDEFLVHLDVQSDRTIRLFGRDIVMATRFDTYEAAEPHAKASKNPAIVGLAFDIGDQVIVVG